MSDKLPEWPVYTTRYLEWVERDRNAALARMEALVEYAQHTGAWCGQGSGHACTCGLSELLAACERKKS